MPKVGHYEGLIQFSCDDGLRQRLVALAYLRRGNKIYAPLARALFERALAEEIESLQGRERTDFERILEDVIITAKVRRMGGVPDPQPDPDTP